MFIPLHRLFTTIAHELAVRAFVPTPQPHHPYDLLRIACCKRVRIQPGKRQESSIECVIRPEKVGGVGRGQLPSGMQAHLINQTGKQNIAPECGPRRS